jgi:uncharacterized membrane protein YsdA (DUF1294 family)/cold shock CspA family protein
MAGAPQWLRGKLVLWNDDRGFGFVRPDAGGDDFFVHISAFRKGLTRRPEIGDVVRYRLAREIPDKKRIAHAVLEGVAVKPAVPEVDRGWRRAYPGLVYVLIRLPILLSCWVLWKQHNPIPLLLYVFMSTLAILYYGADKRRALAHRWRIPEFYLHLIEFLGGWPGALLAQKDFRHKLTKDAYQRVFWGIILLHGGLWIVLAANDFSVSAVGRGFAAAMNQTFTWIFGVG